MTVTAVFPFGIRSFTTHFDPSPSNTTGDTVFADHVNALQVEVAAIEANIGIQANGAFASIRARFENIEENFSPSNHTHTQFNSTVTVADGSDPAASKFVITPSAGSIQLTSSSLNGVMSLQPNGKGVIVGAAVSPSDANNQGLRVTGPVVSNLSMGTPFLDLIPPSSLARATLNFRHPSFPGVANRSIALTADGELTFTSSTSAYPTNKFPGDILMTLADAQVKSDILRCGGTSGAAIFSNMGSVGSANRYPLQIITRATTTAIGLHGIIACDAVSSNPGVTGFLLQMDPNNGGIALRNRVDNAYVGISALSFVVNSERSAKRYIEDSPHGLDAVERLQARRFQWKHEDGWTLGMVADEVHDVVPEVVAMRDDAPVGINYQALVPVLVKAIQELSAKVNALEAALVP